jgi:hypothetical protein
VTGQVPVGLPRVALEFLHDRRIKFVHGREPIDPAE